jgi:hypothetical protein
LDPDVVLDFVFVFVFDLDLDLDLDRERLACPMDVRAGGVISCPHVEDISTLAGRAGVVAPAFGTRSRVG